MESITEVDEHGTTRIYEDDKLHCLLGPAVVYKDGTEEYYKEGVRQTKEDWQKFWDKHKALMDKAGRQITADKIRRTARFQELMFDFENMLAERKENMSEVLWRGEECIARKRAVFEHKMNIFKIDMADTLFKSDFKKKIPKRNDVLIDE